MQEVNQFRVGDRVVRKLGQDWVGTVIAIAGDQVQVSWPPSRLKVGTTRRTWIRTAGLKLADR